MGNNIKKKKLLHELLLLGEKNDFMSNEFVRTMNIKKSKLAVCCMMPSVTWL